MYLCVQNPTYTIRIFKRSCMYFAILRCALLCSLLRENVTRSDTGPNASNCQIRIDINSSGLILNRRHLTGDIFKCIFWNDEYVLISIKMSLNFVPQDPIDNIPALVPIMAWHRLITVQPTSHYLNEWWLSYFCLFQQTKDNKGLLFIMALCRPGDKPLSESMMNILYMRHSASMS